MAAELLVNQKERKKCIHLKVLVSTLTPTLGLLVLTSCSVLQIFVSNGYSPVADLGGANALPSGG